MFLSVSPPLLSKIKEHILRVRKGKEKGTDEPAGDESWLSANSAPRPLFCPFSATTGGTGSVAQRRAQTREDSRRSWNAPWSAGTLPGEAPALFRLLACDLRGALSGSHRGAGRHGTPGQAEFRPQRHPSITSASDLFQGARANVPLPQASAPPPCRPRAARGSDGGPGAPVGGGQLAPKCVKAVF